MDMADLAETFRSSHEELKTAVVKQNGAVADFGSRLSEIEQRLVRRPGPGAPLERKTMGQLVVESPEFAAMRATGWRGSARIQLEEKTVVTIGSGSTSAGPMIAPDVITDPVVLPRVRMTVRALLMPGQTNSNTVWFPRMTARQNNAATVAEGALKPQSDFTAIQVQSTVQCIAHWIRASRFALDDAPALSSLIDGELRYGLALTEETQLLNGDGTGTNLLGLIPQATAYSAPFAITGETAVDRILLAIIQSEQALLPATGVVINTVDWGKIRATKDAVGRYLIGDPASQSIPMLWGLPVVVTPSIAAGSFLVGSFYNSGQIYDRLSPEVLISSEDQDNWVKNLITARAEERLCLICKRPAAFITGTLP